MILLSDMELETHLSVSRYGDFELNRRSGPSYDLKVRPRQGYRHDVYVDEESRSRVPVLMAAVSKERLFDTFMDLIDPLGPVVDVVLQTSHDPSGSGHVDLYREHIDMPVLKSILFDFEDPLTNDGCTGITGVLNPNTPQEVQFDEHKLLIAYGSPLETFEHRLERNRVRCDEKIRFLTEAEHVHSSSEEYHEQFQEMYMRLGMDENHLNHEVV
ncbi:MAG: hypothetical protein R3B96_23270 [Pirellulaceae bacterium]